jgi:predicted esterase
MAPTRILCFHPMAANKDKFEKALSELKSLVGDHVEFHFLNAPNKLEINMKGFEEAYGWFGAKGKAPTEFNWSDFQDPNSSYEGLDESIQAAKKFIEELGGVDGYLGFSQGGAFAQILNCVHHVNFIIVISGFATSRGSIINDESYLLNVYGTIDKQVPNNMSTKIQEYYSAFVNFQHSGSHVIPKGKDLETIVDFIKSKKLTQ